MSEGARCLPAYGLDPRTVVDSPSCSSSGEFCFLCEFERDSEGDCMYGSIVDLIEHLARNKREVPTIVKQVFNVYNQTIRDSIEYTHPDTCQVIKAPAWSTNSIRTHILFSQQFSSCWDHTVRHILHSIIVAQQSRIIDAETGDVFEEKRKGLCDTLKSLQSWEKHIGVRSCSASADSPPMKKRRS